MPYMPFGDGSRVCIGLRMGKMQAKVGLFSMLEKNRFELTKEKRSEQLEFSPKSILLAPIGGLEMNICERVWEIGIRCISTRLRYENKNMYTLYCLKIYLSIQAKVLLFDKANVFAL